MNDLNLGKTGEFPNGKLTPEDEGELKIAIGNFGDTVFLEFGTPVHWFAMQPEQAILIANKLIANAEEIQKTKT